MSDRSSALLYMAEWRILETYCYTFTPYHQLTVQTVKMVQRDKIKCPCQMYLCCFVCFSHCILNWKKVFTLISLATTQLRWMARSQQQHAVWVWLAAAAAVTPMTWSWAQLQTSLISDDSELKTVNMPARKGLLAPQNNFLDTIATRFDGTRKFRL